MDKQSLNDLKIDMKFGNVVTKVCAFVTGATSWATIQDPELTNVFFVGLSLTTTVGSSILTNYVTRQYYLKRESLLDNVKQIAATNNNIQAEKKISKFVRQHPGLDKEIKDAAEDIIEESPYLCKADTYIKTLIKKYSR